MATITEKEPKIVRTFTLSLTEEEASILATVCDHIGGEPTGPRGMFSLGPGNLAEQLEQMDIKLVNRRVQGSILFI